ncbi:MAG: DUF484 family protein [Gammaproteobacteria bacterium]|nr:DUF484 family protein [Gammaproteobacteria bacterium]
MSKTKIINEELTNDGAPTKREQQLAVDLQLISLLRECPDILHRHPELLAELDVPHHSGGAVSLIEKQVAVLREKVKTQDNHLRELMNVARDNERLATSRHNLALHLFAARDHDEVISIVLDALSRELSADYAVIKLFSDDKEKIQQSAGLFVDVNDEALVAFKTMLAHKNTVCGRSTDEQKTYLFADDADDIASVAVIPLVAGANLGLIGLGASDAERFSTSMGTEFLSQIGDLISASLAVHLEK